MFTEITLIIKLGKLVCTQKLVYNKYTGIILPCLRGCLILGTLTTHQEK